MSVCVCVTLYICLNWRGFELEGIEFNYLKPIRSNQ